MNPRHLHDVPAIPILYVQQNPESVVSDSINYVFYSNQPSHTKGFTNLGENVVKSMKVAMKWLQLC